MISSDPNGIVYLKTDQLDGETDWKVREAVGYTQEVGKGGVHLLTGDISYVEADPPSKEIYEFKGTFYTSPTVFEPLRLKNTMWANTVLAVGEAVGLVVYTGKESRMEMNARSPRTKVGKTDEEMNKVSIFLFCFVMVLAVSNLFLSGVFFRERWYIYFFKNVLLMSSIIPISLRVNVDFAKIVYSLKIGRDKRMGEVTVRNTSIPEELGRIEYLLSDKTGTLTRNEMIFKRLATVISTFTRENIDNLIEMIADDINKYRSVGEHSSGAKKKQKYCLAREIITALMVCHNVTPTEDNGER